MFCLLLPASPSPAVRVKRRITLEWPNHIRCDPTAIKPSGLWRDPFARHKTAIFGQDQDSGRVQGHKILNLRESRRRIRVRPGSIPRDVRSNMQGQVFCAALPFAET